MMAHKNDAFDNKKIVIVEDEQQIAEIAQTYFENAGFEVQVFHEGCDAIFDYLKANDCSALVLDLMLPGLDGVEICQRVRKFSDIPIIMTTAKVQELDRIIGLDAGSDDYLCKPYSVKELVARVNAMVRRFHNQLQPNSAETLELNGDNQSLTYGKNKIELTSVLFNLFSLLFNNPNRIYARSQIMDLVYADFRDISDRTIDSHVRNLRKKLMLLELPEDPIRSIYGAGYKYER
jgi:two-component system, OmpR family, response regulator BaeR